MHRWVRRSLAAGAALTLIGAAGIGLLLAGTPGVGDLPARVDARLASHQAAAVGSVIPSRLADAIIATEDSRFAGNHGVDARGVARALLGAGGDPAQGGATLEQQLAKEIYTPADTSLDVVEDVGLALKINADYSKPTIMRLYLDTAYFGDGAWGAEAAAEHYFGVPATRLSWAQASLLAGLVQAPSAYDPHGHLALARSRQSHVLDRLVAVGTLTRAEADAAFDAPLHPAVTFSG